MIEISDEEDFEEFIEQIRLSFWGELTTDELASVETVGDLFDSVVRKMDSLDAPHCLTSVAFFRLRRSLVAISGLDRRALRPFTPLRGLLPPKLRVAWWNAIETELRYRVPGLLPGASASVLYGVALLLFVLLLVFALFWTRPGYIPPITLLAVAAIGLLLTVAARLPRRFPVETLGELAERLVMLNCQQLAEAAGGSTIDQTWKAFRAVVGWATSQSPASIGRNSRLRTPLTRA